MTRLSSPKSGKTLTSGLLVFLALSVSVCADEIARPVTKPEPVTPIKIAPRADVVRQLLERSRLLDDVHFDVPRDLWQLYIRETVKGQVERPPVRMIVEEGLYHLTAPRQARGGSTLAAKLTLHIFDPVPSIGRTLRVLTTKHIWEDVRVNDEKTNLPIVDGWLCFTPTEPGSYVITAKTTLKKGVVDGRTVSFPVLRSVRTLLRFDSPRAWEIIPATDKRRLRGSADAGTHGQLALLSANRLEFRCRRPRPIRRRQARCILTGDVAWNIDAGAQQVTANISIALAGGGTERIDLTLPPGADQLTVTGPDVRRTDHNGNRASVFLRGWIEGRTRLAISFQLPTKEGSTQRLGGLSVRNGRWASGMLVITNTSGAGEVVASSTDGLREVALSDVTRSASSMLAGPAVMAYEITSRSWSATLDVIDLGRFAVTESIADLAHYTLALLEDGSICCRANYEVRNRARQFLRIDLPKGARVLMTRVNEKSVPLTPVPGVRDRYLIPLVRSKASLLGLVSFPVEVTYVVRVNPLEPKGDARLPIVRIDIPIAYAWAELYLPDGMKTKKWTGPLRMVERYSSETASAMLDYGRAEYAEGYDESARPAPKRGIEHATETRPEKRPGLDDRLHYSDGHVRWDEKANRARLARNYYRAGKDLYEKGNYAAARKSLQKVGELAPNIPEANKAGQFVSNIDMLKGKWATKSITQKAAAAQVTGEQQAFNVELERKQENFMEEGARALREGRYKQARTQFDAAEKLGGKLLEQGAKRIEQEARIKTATEQLGRIRKAEAGRASGLRRQLKKQKAKGEYRKALETVKELKDISGSTETFAHEVDDLNIMIARTELAEPRGVAWGGRNSAMSSKSKSEKSAGGTVYVGTARAGAAARPGRKADGGSYYVVPRPIDGIGPDGIAGDVPAGELLKNGRIRSQMERLQAGKQYVADPKAERIARQLLEYSRGILSDDLDRGMKVTESDDAAVELQKHLDRMRTLQGRQFARLMEQWEIFFARKQYDDALLFLHQAELLNPGGADLAGKRDLTLRKKMEFMSLQPGVIRDRETDSRVLHMTEQMTPWSHIYRYPDDWKKLTDSGVRASDQRWDTGKGRLVRRRLEGTIVSFDFNEQPIREAIEYLSTVGNVNIVLDETKLADPAQTFTLKLTNVSLETAIKQLGEQLGVEYAIIDGVVFLSRKGEAGRAGARLDPAAPDYMTMGGHLTGLGSGGGGGGRLVDVTKSPKLSPAQSSVTRIYEVRDLVAELPDFKEPTSGPKTFSPARKKAVDKSCKKLAGLLKEVAEPGAWGGDGKGKPSVVIMDDTISMTGTPETQKRVAKLLENLRSRKGQVQMGRRIATQRAEQRNFVEDVSKVAETYDLRKNKELREFIHSTQPHYGDGHAQWSISDKKTDWRDAAVKKLRYNRGQKVLVNSINLNVDATDADALGITFRTGNNDVTFTVVDDAQLRTLLEMSAKKPMRVTGRNTQETIVGTDALLANAMKANVRFAGDFRNRLDLDANPINLPHEQYVLIDNDGYLTAVKAGPMQHWTEKVTPVSFFDVPQGIDVPRVGRLIKLEKTLLNPEDELVIRVGYKWEGVR